MKINKELYEQLVHHAASMMNNAKCYDKTTQKISHFNFCQHCNQLSTIGHHKTEKDCQRQYEIYNLSIVDEVMNE